MTLEAKGAIASAGLLVGGVTFQSIVPVLLGAALAALAAWFWRTRTAKETEAAKLRTEVGDLQKQLALVSLAVEPINAAMRALLVKELTHFHTPELDASLQIPLGELTDAQEAHQAVMLAERAVTLNGRISASEQEAATIFPIISKRARAEALALKTAPVSSSAQLKVVSVVPAAGTEGEAK